MQARTVGFLLVLCLALPPGPAQAGPAPSARAWVTEVVDRIVRADRAEMGSGRGTVTVRLRILSDGNLDGAAVEGSSGSETLDARALRAVTAAGPFRPPPPRLLTLEGFTELSFDLALGSASRR